jgi:glucokinase-like ROK family protein
LIDDHFVIEKGQGPSAGGKRPTLLDVAQDDHQVLAIDLGSREFRGAVINLRGEIVNFHKYSTGELTGQAALDFAYDLVDKLLDTTQTPILGIGVGTPGLTNPDLGIVREAVNLGWYKLALGDLLADRYDLPIYVANDSHMASLGEYTFGARTGIDNLLVIKIGQGIGAGIVLGGQPFYGDGYGAGEIGHVVVDQQGRQCTCGNFGCLETTSSTRAIIRRVNEAARQAPNSILNHEGRINWNDLVAALQAGDQVARSVVCEAGRFLGVAIANVIATLNIHQIVIAGRVYQLGPSLISSAVDEARRRALPSMVDDTEITYSALGRNVVMLGSAAMILNRELGVI